ncbi:MAG: branched-chain amino acid ABC transporter permease [Candidatus Hodarchaeota archaeon]
MLKPKQFLPKLKQIVINSPEKAIFVATFILLALFPIASRNLYWMQAIMFGMFMAAIATSNDLLYGYSGILSVTPLAFWAIGGFTAAVLAGGTHPYVPGGADFIGFALNPWLAILLAGVFTAIIGVALAFPSLRIRGIYLAFLLIAFSELVVRVLRNEEWLTGGTIGFRLSFRLPFLPVDRYAYYYLVLGFLVISIVILRKFTSSRIGLIIRAMRDNETATKHLGIETLRYRLIAFGVSTFLMGVCGGLYAFIVNYITFDMGDTMQSFFIVVMSIFGGIGTLVGPFIGALLFIILSEYLRWMQELRMVFFGIILLAVVLYLPKGIIGTVLDRIKRWRIKTELEGKK